MLSIFLRKSPGCNVAANQMGVKKMPGDERTVLHVQEDHQDEEEGLLSGLTQAQINKSHQWQFFSSWSTWAAANAAIGDWMFSFLKIHVPDAMQWVAENFPTAVLVLMPPVMSMAIGLLKACIILKCSGYTDTETKQNLERNMKTDKEGVIKFTGVWAAINLPTMAIPLIALYCTPKLAETLASWVQPGVAPLIKGLLGLLSAKAVLACVHRCQVPQDDVAFTSPAEATA